MSAIGYIKIIMNHFDRLRIDLWSISVRIIRYLTNVYFRMNINAYHFKCPFQWIHHYKIKSLKDCWSSLRADNLLRVISIDRWWRPLHHLEFWTRSVHKPVPLRHFWKVPKKKTYKIVWFPLSTVLYECKWSILLLLCHYNLLRQRSSRVLFHEWSIPTFVFVSRNRRLRFAFYTHQAA